MGCRMESCWCQEKPDSLIDEQRGGSLLAKRRVGAGVEESRDWGRGPGGGGELALLGWGAPRAL